MIPASIPMIVTPGVLGDRPDVVNNQVTVADLGGGRQRREEHVSWRTGREPGSCHTPEPECGSSRTRGGQAILHFTVERFWRRPAPSTHIRRDRGGRARSGAALKKPVRARRFDA